MLIYMPMQRFLLLQPTRKLSYIKYGTGRFVKRNVTFYSFGEEISTQICLKQFICHVGFDIITCTRLSFFFIITKNSIFRLLISMIQIRYILPYLIYYTIGFALTCARGFCIIFGKFQERSSEHTRARDRSTFFTLLRPCVCNNFEGPKFRMISSGVTMGGYTKSTLMCSHSASSPLSPLPSPLSAPVLASGHTL